MAPAHGSVGAMRAPAGSAPPSPPHTFGFSKGKWLEISVLLSDARTEMSDTTVLTLVAGYEVGF